MGLSSGPDQTRTSLSKLSPWSTYKIWMDGFRVTHPTHIVSLIQEQLIHLFCVFTSFPIFLSFFPFIPSLVKRGQHIFQYFFSLFPFLRFELYPFAVYNETKYYRNINLVDIFWYIFIEEETRVLRRILLPWCYTPNPHLGAKIATQKGKYTSHSSKYFGLSTSKEIKQSGERPPLKNDVHNTQESNTIPMSDPLYGLTHWCKWSQNLIRTHG